MRSKYINIGRCAYGYSYTCRVTPRKVWCAILEFYFNKEMIIVKQKSIPLDVFESLSKKTRERFERKGLTEKDMEEEIQASRSGG